LSTSQTFGTADDIGSDFHVQRVYCKQYAGKYCCGSAAQHATSSDGEQDGDCSVQGDVDDVVAEGAQLMEVMVESEGDGGKRAVTEVRARFVHVATP
jgi:hypothetical protein